MFAVIRTGGKQYRVREGDSVVVERLDSAAGDDIVLDDVLLIGGDGDLRIGTPTVEGASVSARIEEQFRGPKLRVFKYKNKTRRRTLRGHRQYQTRLTINGISGGS